MTSAVFDTDGYGCVTCGVRVRESTDLACPRCGQAFEALTSALAVDATDEDEDAVQVPLIFSTFVCESCAAEFYLDAGESCPSCGTPASQRDPHWVRRHGAYGDAISQLLDETRSWREGPLVFTDRGERLEPRLHLEWLAERACNHAIALLDSAKGLLRATDWEDPGDSVTVDAFAELLRVCRRFAALVQELAATPPPVELLGVHRQATRAVAVLGDAVIRFVSLLDSPYCSAAFEAQEAAQDRLDLAGQRLSHLSINLERLERVVVTPGFWVIGDEYDTGRVAWEGIDQQVSTVSQAAEAVRNTFSEVPGLSTLPDEQAFMLMPAAAVGASLQDLDRLTERAATARALLDAADRAEPGWVDDQMLLVEQIWRGHRELIDQVVRLGHALRADTPRRLLLQTAIDVFAKFYEGPLCRLGGIVALAADAAAGEGVHVSNVDNYGPKKTPTTLAKHGPILMEGVLAGLRHAESHYDFELDDTGITFRFLADDQRPERTEWFRDDDFLEQLVNLNEAIMGLELALLPWLETRPDSTIQGELERRSRARETVFEILRALAGLTGWTEVEFHFNDRVLRVSGVYRGPVQEEPSLGLLPMVAAVWDNFEEVRQVDLGPALGCELTLTLQDFPSEGASELVTQHHIALLTARVLEQAGSVTAVEVDVRWRLMPAMLLPWNAARNLADSPSPEAATTLVAYLKWLDALLAETQVAPSLATLLEELRPLLRKLRRAVAAWHSAQPGASRLAERAGDDVIATGEKLRKLAVQCQNLLS